MLCVCVVTCWYDRILVYPECMVVPVINAIINHKFCVLD